MTHEIYTTVDRFCETVKQICYMVFEFHELCDAAEYRRREPGFLRRKALRVIAKDRKDAPTRA